MGSSHARTYPKMVEGASIDYPQVALASHNVEAALPSCLTMVQLDRADVPLNAYLLPLICAQSAMALRKAYQWYSWGMGAIGV